MVSSTRYGIMGNVDCVWGGNKIMFTVLVYVGEDEETSYR